MLENMTVALLEAPTKRDWAEVYRRAMVTIGRKDAKYPEIRWRRAILEARHSPIRYLRFSFALDAIPYWVACELRTHVHDMPYVADYGVYIKSSRNDRQRDFDRSAARQDAPVSMILDCNPEQLMVMANKRLCTLASAEARETVARMCALAEESMPELAGLLTPMCEYHGGVCHEMRPCGRCKKEAQSDEQRA